MEAENKVGSTLRHQLIGKLVSFSYSKHFKCFMHLFVKHQP